jgi:hypothetical protein
MGAGDGPARRGPGCARRGCSTLRPLDSITSAALDGVCEGGYADDPAVDGGVWEAMHVARALARSVALELVNNHLDWLSLAPTTAVLRCSPPSTDSRRGIPSGAVDCGSPAGGTGSCAPHQHAEKGALGGTGR